MKKITEKQLMEAARALRDYTDMMEANLIPAAKAAGTAASKKLSGLTNTQKLGAGVTTAAAAGNAILNPGQIPQAPSSAEADDLALGQQNLKAIQQAPAAQQQAAPAAQQQAPAAPDQSWAQKVGSSIRHAAQGVVNTGKDFAAGLTGDTPDHWEDTPASQQSAKPAQPAAQQQAQSGASAWPTTPQAIVAFQKSHGLKPDGLIGPNTMTALARDGIQPPAGFKMASAKKPAAAPAKKPATPTDVMSQSPEEAEDERIAQNQAFYNMTPQQQAAYNAGIVQQDANKAAAAKKAQDEQQAAQPQPGMQQGVQAAKSALTPDFTSQQQPVKETVSFSNDDSLLSRIVFLSKR